MDEKKSFLSVVGKEDPPLCLEEQLRKRTWVLCKDLLERIRKRSNDADLLKSRDDIIVLLTALYYKYDVLVKESIRDLTQISMQRQRITQLTNTINAFDEPGFKFVARGLLKEESNPLWGVNKVLKKQLEAALLKAAKYETLYKELVDNISKQ